MAQLQTPPNTDTTLSLMIVEDEPMTSKLAASYLKQFGSVITTSNPREAVANYMVNRPHIVFLDIHFGNDSTNGFDVLRSILSADEQAFVVMVSADQDPQILTKALELGAQGFIAKPFRAIDFSYYLTRLILSQRAEA